MDRRSAAPSPGKRLREVVSTPTAPKRSYATARHDRQRQRRQTLPFGIPTTHDLPLPGSVSSPPPLPGSLSDIGSGSSQPASQPSSGPGDGSSASGDGGQSSPNSDSSSTPPGDGGNTPSSGSPSGNPSQPSNPPSQPPPPPSQPPSSAPSSASPPSSNPPSDSNSNPNSNSPPGSQSTPSDSVPSTPSLPSSTPSDSSSSAPSSPTDAPLSPSDGNAQAASVSAQTTITSTFVTDINGVQTTIVTAIPTTLSNDSTTSGTSAQQRRAIIAGTSIAGVALLCIIISLIFFCRRRNYRKARVFNDEVQENPRSRSMLLAEEFDDTEGPHMGYRDYPASLLSSAQSPSPYPGAAAAAGSTDSHQNAPRIPTAPVSPHVMGMRASESGSIFREAVWPPPGEASRLVDPIVAGSSQVNLTRIVDDVMGPSPTNSEGNVPPPPKPPYAMGAALHIRGGSGSSQVSLDSPPQDPFKTPPSAYAPYEPHYRNPSAYSLTGGGSPSPYHTPSHSYDNLGSPSTPPRMGPLYVTNGAAGSPLGSPMTSPKNWLERTPKLAPDGESSKRLSATGSFIQRMEGGGASTEAVNIGKEL